MSYDTLYSRSQEKAHCIDLHYSILHTYAPLIARSHIKRSSLPLADGDCSDGDGCKNLVQEGRARISL